MSLRIEDIIEAEGTEAEQLEAQGFVIDNDSKAEWALKKIKAAQYEHDRLEDLIAAEHEVLTEKKRKIDEQLSRETGYLKYMLNQYMDSVNCKETKTQRTYQLLTGKLVRKVGGIDYIRDDEQLLIWARANRPGCIKIKESLDWAGFKKELTVEEDGTVITSDGEVLEAVRAEKKEDTFDIKF